MYFHIEDTQKEDGKRYERRLRRTFANNPPECDVTVRKIFATWRHGRVLVVMNVLPSMGSTSQRHYDPVFRLLPLCSRSAGYTGSLTSHGAGSFFRPSFFMNSLNPPSPAWPSTSCKFSSAFSTTSTSLSSAFVVWFSSSWFFFYPSPSVLFCSLSLLYSRTHVYGE